MKLSEHLSVFADSQVSPVGHKNKYVSAEGQPTDNLECDFLELFLTKR